MDPVLRVVADHARRSREQLARRDAAIVIAREAGYTARAIGEAAGLTHPTVLKIIKQADAERPAEEATP